MLINTSCLFFKKNDNDPQVAENLSKSSKQIKGNKNVHYRLNFVNTHTSMQHLK